MTRAMFSLILLLGTTVCAAAAEPNATLDVLHGKVLVNSGDGFEVAGNVHSVNSGDRVMISAGAAAVLFSAETGCVMAFRRAGTYSIPNLEECVAGQAVVLANDINIQPTNGYPPGELVVLPPAPPSSAFGFGPILVGGAFVVGVAGVAIYASTSSRDDDQPISSH